MELKLSARVGYSKRTKDCLMYNGLAQCRCWSPSRSISRILYSVVVFDIDPKKHGANKVMAYLIPNFKAFHKSKRPVSLIIDRTRCIPAQKLNSMFSQSLPQWAGNPGTTWSTMQAEEVSEWLQELRSIVTFESLPSSKSLQKFVFCILAATLRRHLAMISGVPTLFTLRYLCSANCFFSMIPAVETVRRLVSVGCGRVNNEQQKCRFLIIIFKKGCAVRVAFCDDSLVRHLVWLTTFARTKPFFSRGLKPFLV